ncbi:MAG: nucleotidyltransferase substrate binding protein [Balneolaceae bacterium]|nr:nucleotidyltransferase substrate binding protein [Balneolaceae bacterium]
MPDQDIRWKQRFSNYQKAFGKLAEVVENKTLGQLTDLEKEGLIQRFEYTYELAWKVMKDYLEFQGITGITGSRDAIRESFQKEIISEGEGWMEMIKSRNQTAHLYNEATAQEIAENIVNVYFNLFDSFNRKMENLK